ncbi:LuxR C-terminal-related transcriptional regulator [Streptomyces sp. NBC_01433]|uniref:helix-turn-helix transcriptional regulator n=1 Tax=Streptomyces sp. NBC_01433 TaxID=2903864 RepID=UPI002258B672|nr:LuxR C-terminal-related transcriptional regulator [Streptomyces sp. NBC_01433]MCX4680628.1 LuxR C-terminal-related transcriptional regulator [Streptomyces sp. NBC_01433]
MTGIRSRVATTQAVYQRFHSAAGAPIEAYVGRNVIQAAVETAVRECREELLTAQPGRADTLESPWGVIAPDLRPGVRRRALCRHTVRSHGPSLAYLERLAAAGAEVRTVEDISDCLIICDQKVAFIPGDEARTTSAVAIRHPGAVQHLVRVFTSTWGRAEPIGPLSAHERPPQLTDDVRRAVLRLMVDGYTDGAIAARLGMSARTVATHIKKTADDLGSRSRAQLAYRIARSDLLVQDGVGQRG